MKESDKKRLQMNCRDLVSNILVADIQDYLYEKDVISGENLETLININEKSPERAARYLVVSILPKKGPQAFGTFCEALRENNYEYLADQLENTKVERTTNNVSANNGASCSNNKCVNERKLLKHKTKDLEDELTDMATKIQNVTCEDNITPERRKRDKEKIEQLEMENFKLKKQLSFYEEPNTRAKPKRRVTSEPTISLPNPRNNESSITSLDSGLSDMEDIVVDIDDTFDNIDGASTERSSAYSTISSSRTVVTPRFQKRNVVDNEDEDEEENLINVLATDIVNCMYNNTESNLRLFSPHHIRFVTALRQAVNIVAEKHETIFDKIGKQVDLKATWREINQQMASLYNDLLVDEFHQNALSWGKILALFSLTGFVAKRCAQRDKVALPLSEFLADYVERKLAKKIDGLGGWETLCDHLEQEEINFTCIFPATMLQAAINPGTRASATGSATRRKGLGKTHSVKLLDKRPENKLHNFLKTA